MGEDQSQNNSKGQNFFKIWKIKGNQSWDLILKNLKLYIKKGEETKIRWFDCTDTYQTRIWRTEDAAWETPTEVF